MYFEPFKRENNMTFLEMMYQLLPHQYQIQEINRLTLAYFIVSGVDLLHALHRLRIEFCHYKLTPKTETKSTMGADIQLGMAIDSMKEVTLEWQVKTRGLYKNLFPFLIFLLGDSQAASLNLEMSS